MNARRISAAIVGVSVAVVMAGCAPASGSASGGCDGWGPLANCGGSGNASSAKPASYGGGCDPSGFGPLSGCNGNGSTANTADPAFHCGTAADCADPARHEAGHVEVAKAFGWAIQLSTIDGHGNGHTVATVWCDCPVQRIAYAKAGAIASPMTDVSDVDQGVMDKALNTLPLDQQADVEDQGRALAERIVAQRSAQIDRDAAHLRKTGRL